MTTDQQLNDPRYYLPYSDPYFKLYCSTSFADTAANEYNADGQTSAIISPIEVVSTEDTSFPATISNQYSAVGQDHREYYEMQPFSTAKLQNNIDASAEDRIEGNIEKIFEVKTEDHEFSCESNTRTFDVESNNIAEHSDSNQFYEGILRTENSLPEPSTNIYNSHDLHAIPQFSCQSCGLKFQKWSSFCRHRTECYNSTDENKKISCDECDRKFITIGYMKQHYSAVHDIDKKHKCSKCSKKFITEEKLNDHMEKHFVERPHPCSDCNRRFHLRTDLSRHRRVHTNSLIYCHICGKGFQRLSHREAHYLVHSNEINRIPKLRKPSSSL